MIRQESYNHFQNVNACGLSMHACFAQKRAIATYIYLYMLALAIYMLNAFSYYPLACRGHRGSIIGGSIKLLRQVSQACTTFKQNVYILSDQAAAWFAPPPPSLSDNYAQNYIYPVYTTSICVVIMSAES